MNKEKSIYACYEEIKQREISELKEKVKMMKDQEYIFKKDETPYILCNTDNGPKDVRVGSVAVHGLSDHEILSIYDMKGRQIKLEDIAYSHIEFVTNALPKPSPIIQQYNELKEKYPDALLLFRCGDFYETYEVDAVNAAKALGITLTHRNREFQSPVEMGAMAGFPRHALDTYLPKLIRAGYRVVIVDELEDQRFKKPVKRGITELISPNPLK